MNRFPVDPRLDHDPRPGRWRVLTGALVVGLVLAVPGVLIGIQWASTALGNRAWRGSDAVAAESWHSLALRTNVVERWMAPYNRGTASFAKRSWQAAADDFEHAAELAPEAEQCRVRLNWSWSLEALGDEFAVAGDRQAAAAYWTQAEQVLIDARCPVEEAASAKKPEEKEPDEPDKEPKDPAKPEPEPGNPEPGGSDDVTGLEEHVDQPSGSQQEQQERTLERLDGKRRDGQPVPGTEAEDKDGGEPDPAGQLRERQQRAQLEQQQAEDSQDVPENTDSDGRNW